MTQNNARNNETDPREMGKLRGALITHSVERGSDATEKKEQNNF